MAVSVIDEIDQDIRQGLQRDAGRLYEARQVEDYYLLRNESYMSKRSVDDSYDKVIRTSAILRCVVRKLTKPLYATGPSREWEGDDRVNQWLQVGFYGPAHVTLRMAQADRAAILHHVSAIQAEATGDLRNPIRLWLWKGNEFFCHFPENDPLTPDAVTTTEHIQLPGGRMQTRYRIWTAQTRRTLLSEPWRSAGLRSFGAFSTVKIAETEDEPNPYRGIIPFAFVRAEPAECAFWQGGIGPALMGLNRTLDEQLSDVAQHVKEFLNPRGWVRNVSIESRFLDRIGRFFHLRPDPAARAGDYKAEPDIGYLQANLAVEQAWYDIKTYADSYLEELEIPLTVVRSDASTDLSGVAIVAKSIPIVEWTRARQPEFVEYERSLASVVLAIAGTWYGDSGLVAASEESERLMCVWPEPRAPIPTSERNESDQWELEQGLADPIEVLARRRGVTLAQAEELARDIMERRKVWSELVGVVAEESDGRSGIQGNGREPVFSRRGGSAETSNGEKDGETDSEEG